MSDNTTWLCVCVCVCVGWQLTEVDEPYQQTASLARQAQAQQLAESAAAESATGADPDAISHASDSTHAQHPPSSTTHQAATQSSNSSSSSSSRSSSSRQSRNPVVAMLLSIWFFVNKVLGGVIGKVMYALNDRLASTDPPAWALRGVSALATGPLRHTILKMYSEAGDHSRRLTPVKANAKFSSDQAGPDEPWQVYSSITQSVLCLWGQQGANRQSNHTAKTKCHLMQPVQPFACTASLLLFHVAVRIRSQSGIYSLKHAAQNLPIRKS